MRKLGLVLLGAAAMAASSAASAVEFAGTTQGCLRGAADPACTPVNTSTIAGLTFTTGSFDQNTSASGFAAIGSGNTDTLGFFSASNTAFNYTGDVFTLLVNFTLPAGVGGGGTYSSILFGDISGTPNNGGVQISFAPSTQFFTLAGGGTFTLTVNNLSVGGGNVNSPITGYILAAVPEPSTWAMMLVGFGGIGLAMRRRPVLAQIA